MRHHESSWSASSVKRFPAIQTDLAGRVCVVTGASAGIGMETARTLARLGATVVMACRNAQKGEAVRQEIVRATRNDRVKLEVVDLSSQRSIRAFAARLIERHPAIHVLVNNAGVWLKARSETSEGIETTWATNQLGYFLTTQLLLPMLRAGAPSRIVNVASNLAKGLDLDDVEYRRRRFDGRDAYAQSKQANRMWTWALARRLEGSGVVANAMHPGVVATELFRKAGSVIGAVASAAVSVFGRSLEEGADTVVWLAASPDAAGFHGRYWMDRRELHCPFRSIPAQEALWSLCERMTDRS